MVYRVTDGPWELWCALNRIEPPPPLESNHCILVQLFEGLFGIMDEHVLLIEVHSTMHCMHLSVFCVTTVCVYVHVCVCVCEGTGSRVEFTRPCISCTPVYVTWCHVTTVLYCIVRECTCNYYHGAWVCTRMYMLFLQCLMDFSSRRFSCSISSSQRAEIPNQAGPKAVWESRSMQSNRGPFWLLHLHGRSWCSWKIPTKNPWQQNLWNWLI